jgi:hypothetical protein
MTEPNTGRRSWRKLLGFLFDREFTYTLSMDENRADDGIDLRYRFLFETKNDSPALRKALDDRPCSVLEMMVALALRCEEHIMSDSSIGNRTGHWFWSMVQNLGLSSMYDSIFDYSSARHVIMRFLNRDYQPNGAGGLFRISDERVDLRDMEIWYQMMWYLGSNA